MAFGKPGDIVNNRVRKVDPKTGIIATFAGTGERAATPAEGAIASIPVSGPRSIEIAPDGTMYLADTNNNRVRMINLTDGTIQTVAGTGEEGYSGDAGPATEAQLNRPFGVAFDQNGDLYISDTFNSRVRKVER